MEVPKELAALGFTELVLPKAAVTPAVGALSCELRGTDEIRRVQCKVCGDRRVELRVYGCRAYGECTLLMKADGVAGVCSIKCPHRRVSSAPPLEWVSTRRLVQDTIQLLLPKLPVELSGVVGVPRSGMIPAAVLATMLDLPLYSLPDMRLVTPNSRSVRGGQHPKAPRLIVDDTVYSGRAMGTLKVINRTSALFAAVYVRPDRAGDVDFHGRVLPSPHLLEWNLFNNRYPLLGANTDSRMQGGCALDFDGILCLDGGEGKPLYLSRAHPIPLVITGRSERHRAVSEAWLFRWGVRVQRMVMRPADVGESAAEIGTWKGGVFKSSPQALYIESDPAQAQIIHEVSGKPVVCPAIEQVFQ